MQTEILEANELRQRATNEPFQRVSMAESDGAPTTGQLVEHCDELARAATPFETTKSVSCLLLKMSLKYYEDVRLQADRSFKHASRIAFLGTMFFLVAIGFAWAQKSDAVRITMLAGALIHVISGINFYLYRRASKQFESFHICLERTQRCTLANLTCESLKDNQEQMRSELVRVMANAPMLTLCDMNGSNRSHRNSAKLDDKSETGSTQNQ